VDSRYPVRLDLNTKLSIMAAIIFALSETPIEKIVDAAVELESAVDKRVKEIKKNARGTDERDPGR
jgi:hypothetical protein